MPQASAQSQPCVQVAVNAKTTAAELVSLAAGIAAISTHWIVVFEDGFLYFIIPMILGLLATSIGCGGAFRALSVKGMGGRVGLAGTTLGILALMYAIAWLMLAQRYFWGWPL